MTTTHDWLSANHQGLYNQGKQTFNYLSDPMNRDRMGFGPGTPQGQWLDTVFQPTLNAFTAAFNNWNDPATRTPVKTALLNDTEKVFKETYRELYTGLLRTSPLVTNEDLLEMGMPKHSTGERHPSDVADEAPDVDVDTSIIGRLIIHFFEKGHRHKKAKPAGQHGAEIAWAILDAPPTKWSELIHSEIDTNSPFTLSFEHDLRGKTVYFALRWENTRGEKGPWSEIQSAIIP
jgi:hypothetical protein